MRKNLVLYVTFIICLFIQVFIMCRILWFPDIILLMVIFTGVFFDIFSALIFAFVAGFLGAFFSINMTLLNIIVFPISVVASAVLAKLFYKHNFAVQSLISFIVIISGVILETCYFNIVLCNSVELILPLSFNWKQIIFTVIFCPFFFMLLKKLLKIKD